MEKLGAINRSSDIFEKANIGLWAFELDEGCAPRMYANDAMLKLIGLDHQVPPEETYHAWYDNIDENAYGLVADAVEKMTAGEHAEVQYPWHHPDGETWIVRCGGVRNFEYKKGIRIEGTHQNVTEILHFDERELAENAARRDREIIGILASEYSSVYYIDLTTDGLTPYTMNEETETTFGSVFRSGITYSEAYKLYVDKLIYDADKQMMLKAGSIENIKYELANKKTFLTQYRSSDNKYSEMKFVKVGGDNDEPLAVALGFADRNKEIRAELERAAADARDRAVISGLSDDFGCVVYVGFDDRSEIHYRFDPLFEKHIPNWSTINNFGDRLNTLIETVMHPDDRKEFYEATREDIVHESVNRDGVYYVNFRTLINGEVTYYQAKFVKDENSDDHVIAGFHNVDEETKRELQALDRAEVASRHSSSICPMISGHL